MKVTKEHKTARDKGLAEQQPWEERGGIVKDGGGAIISGFCAACDHAGKIDTSGMISEGYEIIWKRDDQPCFRCGALGNPDIQID